MATYTILQRFNNNVLIERDVLDTTANTYTVFDGNGAQVSQRAATAQDLAAAAQLDIASNQATIVSRANAAITANATFLALGAPTNAQVVAQVQLLTRECNTLIKLALGLLSDTSGT